MSSAWMISWERSPIRDVICSRIRWISTSSSSSRRTNSLFCSIVSSGSTNTVWPLELALCTTPGTRRLCSVFTGMTKRSPRMVTTSSCNASPSDNRRKRPCNDCWIARRCFSISRRMAASAGEALSSRVPSGRILLRNPRRNSVKSAIPPERCRTAVQSCFIARGGFNAISRHSAARSTSRITSRISIVSRAAPEMRDFSSSSEMSANPENSKCPPTRRNSRISAVS